MGVAALVAGLMRLGFLAAFISEPVLKGFIIGLALTIIIGQVPALLGVDKGSGNFFEQAGAAGARSQVSSLTAGALTLVTLLFLTGLFEQLPEATLSAIVIAAVVELVDIASLRRIYRVVSGPVASVYRVTARADFFAAIGALFGVLLFDTLPGLVIGIAISLALLIARTSRLHLAPLAPVGDGPARPWVDTDRNPDHATLPGVLVVRVEGPLMFANADYVRTSVRALAHQTPDLRLVVLDGQSTPSIDVTAAGMLVQLREDVRRLGAELVLADDIGQVRDVLSTAEPTGEPPMFPSIEAAIAAGPDTGTDTGAGGSFTGSG